MTTTPTLATLIRRADRAVTKAKRADYEADHARIDLHAEARRIIWAALEKRGIAKGDLIGFTDPKRAHWLDRPARLNRIEAYRGFDMAGKPEWRIRLHLTMFNARGKALLTPTWEHFEVQHPRDVAKEIVKVKA